MPRARGRALLVVFAFAPILPGCSGDETTFDGGFDPEHGGRYDASSCGAASHSTPVPPACTGKPGQGVYALAICGDLAANNTLTLDERSAPDGAALAIDGATHLGSPLHVAGAMRTAGTVVADNTQEVMGDLRIGGDWTVRSPASVGGDAFVAGELDATNQVSIAGALHVAPGTDVEGIDAESVVFEQVALEAPLACASAPNIADLVHQLLEPWVFGDRDLEVDSLAHLQAPAEILLGCTGYRFSSIGAENTLTLRIVGTTLLVVEGDLHVASPMKITVDPGASLVLVIGGALVVDNTLEIGDAAHPEAAWVGVAGDIHVASPMTLAGLLIAPKSHLFAQNTLDVTGAAYVGPLDVGSPVEIHDGPFVSPDGSCDLETPAK